MCIVLRYFSLLQELHDIEIANREKREQDPDMRKGSVPPVRFPKMLQLNNMVIFLDEIQWNCRSF